MEFECGHGPQELTTAHYSQLADCGSAADQHYLITIRTSSKPWICCGWHDLIQMFCMIGVSHRGTQESRDVARKSILYS